MNIVSAQEKSFADIGPIILWTRDIPKGRLNKIYLQ